MGGLEILELIREYHTVLILDAIKTKEGMPGDVIISTLKIFTKPCTLQPA